MSALLRTVLQGRQPKLMPLAHGVRLLLTELNAAGALFRDDVAPLTGLGKKERVIGMDALPSPNHPRRLLGSNSHTRLSMWNPKVSHKICAFFRSR